MSKLTDYVSYSDAQKHFSRDALWNLFDGDRDSLNIAHECVDRYAHRSDVAIRIAHDDGSDEFITWPELARRSSHVAHHLQHLGVKPGDRVAIMLEPSLAFYAALFGILKAGAVAVPLFTLFATDAIKVRVHDCNARWVFTNQAKAEAARAVPDLHVIVADSHALNDWARYPDGFQAQTHSNDLAIIQYTSGTTREVPAAVHQAHKSVVTLMISALYTVGLRPGDIYFCPSSPAWSHGLWPGTLAPLALGVPTGTMAGRFDATRMMQALQDYGITNMSAAATHYRMMRNSGATSQYRFHLKKLSYAGEPLDSETEAYLRNEINVAPCSIYGSSEVGAVLAHFPGAPDLEVRPGSLGKPVPGVDVQVQDADGQPCQPGVIGELKVWRRNSWIPIGDLGRIDDDGYFYHAGRADDIIISAGWTISAIEVEDVILQHPDVKEVAAVASPDSVRGHVVKAFVVSTRDGSDEFIDEIQTLVRTRLSPHEYPRRVAFVAELPKNPAGKINRRVLRDQEQQQAAVAA